MQTGLSASAPCDERSARRRRGEPSKHQLRLGSGRAMNYFMFKFTRKEQTLNFATLLKVKSEFLGCYKDLTRIFLRNYDLPGIPRTS